MLVRYCDLCKKAICRGEGRTVRTPELAIKKLNYAAEYKEMDICYQCSVKVLDFMRNFNAEYEILEEVT